MYTKLLTKINAIGIRDFVLKLNITLINQA